VVAYADADTPDGRFRRCRRCGKEHHGDGLHGLGGAMAGGFTGS
jgi:hypothetical protein